MSSPYLVTIIGVTTMVALAAIAVTSSDQMNYSLSVQNAMQMETIKNQETLVLIVQNDILDVQNNALNPVKVLEFRLTDKTTNVTKIISYSAFPLIISDVNKKFTPVDFNMITFSNKKIMAITELGNVFTAINFNDPSAFTIENSTGVAMINGLGVNSRIVQLDYFGKILHGQGMTGNEDTLKPYVFVPTTNNYVAEILNSDLQTTTQIPKFNAEYQYDGDHLHLSTITAHNILSYSQSRTVGGGGISSQNSNGIVFSGTGQIIVKLNDLGTQTLRLDGTVPNGAKLRLIEKFNTDVYDLMTIPYDNTYGFNIGTGMVSTTSTVYSGYCGAPCGFGTVYYGTYYYSASLSLEISSLSNFVAKTPTISFTPLGTQNANSYTVRSANYQESYSYYLPKYNDLPSSFNPSILSNSIILYYDKSPGNTLLTFTDNFIGNTQQITLGKQYYLIAEPNGGTITVSGVAYDPSAPYLKITNLPSNIPYEIVNGEYVIASGMIPTNGSLILLLNDIDIKETQGTTPAGTLHLYPNSLAYRGSFRTVVFDNINNQTINIPTEDVKSYVTHAYVQIPITGSVSITDTNLNGGTLGMISGALSLPYLNGNYYNGDLIKIPIIPGYLRINMTINGIPTITVISNVLGGTGIKIIKPATQIITDQNANSILPFIESTTGTVTCVIATTSGNLNANFLAVISGSAFLSNTVTLTAVPPTPPVVYRKDPLTGWMDVYKNGILVQSVQLFFNDLPIFTSSNHVSETSQIQTASYTYTQTTISGTSVISVLPGDVIEYYLYAKVKADGIPLTAPVGLTISTMRSQGIATATIHSGSIQTSG